MIPFEQFVWSLGWNPDDLDETQTAALRRVYLERYAADDEDEDEDNDDDEETTVAADEDEDAEPALELDEDSATNAAARTPRLTAGATAFRKSKVEGWAVRWGRALTPQVSPAIKGTNFIVFDGPGAFLRAYRQAANGTRDIKLTIDHDPARVLAGTRDDSLVLHLVRGGLRWHLDTAKARGRSAANWLKQNPTYRAVSIGGAVTDYRRSHLTAHVERFDLAELSFVVRPAARDATFTL